MDSRTIGGVGDPPTKTGVTCTGHNCVENMVDGIDTTANDIRIYKHGPVVAGVLTAGKDNDPVAAARCASDAVRQTLLLSSSAAVDDDDDGDNIFIAVRSPMLHVLSSPAAVAAGDGGGGGESFYCIMEDKQLQPASTVEARPRGQSWSTRIIPIIKGLDDFPLIGDVSAIACTAAQLAWLSSSSSSVSSVLARGWALWCTLLWAFVLAIQSILLRNHRKLVVIALGASADARDSKPFNSSHIASLWSRLDALREFVGMTPMLADEQADWNHRRGGRGGAADADDDESSKAATTTAQLLSACLAETEAFIGVPPPPELTPSSYHHNTTSFVHSLGRRIRNAEQFVCGDQKIN